MTTNVLRALFASVLLVILSACADSSMLTEAEAMRLIRQHKGYPAPVAITYADVYRKDPLFPEASRLEREGYIVPGNAWAAAEVKEKGKGVVRNLVSTSIGGGGYAVFSPITHRLDVKRVTDILVDKKTNTAVVKYEITVTPTEYLQTLMKIDRARTERAVREEFGGTDTWQKEIRFKKWDQGWRVDGN